MAVENINSKNITLGNTGVKIPLPGTSGPNASLKGVTLPNMPGQGASLKGIPLPDLPGQNVQNPGQQTPAGSEQLLRAQELANLIASGQPLPDGVIDPQISVEMVKIRAEQAFLQATFEQADLAVESSKDTDRAELESMREVEQTPNRAVDNRFWDMLLSWRQNSQLSAEQNLKDLQALFQMLLKQIMSDYRGDVQLQLLAQLDSLTMNAIKQMMFERSADLMDFLGQYGRPGTNQQIMESLFKAVAGRAPIILSGELFGSDGLSSSKGQGVIYQKSAHGVQVNADYQNRIDKSENRQSQAAELLRRGANGKGFFNLSGRTDFALQQSGRASKGEGFSPRDISQAQAFVQYLKQNFPAVEPAKLPYTSEEYIGFSAGTLALKLHALADKKGMGNAMSSALKYAVDSYAQNYFLQSAQALKQSSLFKGKSSYPAMKADDFQKVYHYMVNTYEDKKDAQSSMLAGLQRASESFHAKQKDAVYQKAERYFSETGFFSRSAIHDLEREILDGWKAICKDWNDFLKFAQIPIDKTLRFLPNMDYNSYMAILLAYERAAQQKDGPKVHKPIPYMVKWGTAIVIVGTSAVVISSMLFR